MFVYIVLQLSLLASVALCAQVGQASYDGAHYGGSGYAGGYAGSGGYAGHDARYTTVSLLMDYKIVRESVLSQLSYTSSILQNRVSNKQCCGCVLNMIVQTKGV